MQGFRTLITHALGLVFAGLSHLGVVVPQSDQAAIMTGALAVAGIWWRFKTTGPVFTNPTEQSVDNESES